MDDLTERLNNNLGAAIRAAVERDGFCPACGCPMYGHDAQGCLLHKGCQQAPATTEPNG